MGAWIDFTNHIHIAKETWENGILKEVGYKDITSEMIEEIAQNNRIQWIQIDKNLPESAYREIDRILERRPDLYFRIFGIGTYGNETFDLSVLSLMPHLSKIRIDGHLEKDKEAVNPEYLCELRNLKGVHLTLFDRLDYGFVKDLSADLEELILYADTMGKTVQFNCEWLLKYQKLRTLFLGKRAKKHLESINRIASLKSLSLNGIKVGDFAFLKEINLDSFALLWCGNNDLTALGDLISLRNLELWRIMKLDNFTQLTDIQINNVPIDLETLDESVRKLVHS